MPGADFAVMLHVCLNFLAKISFDLLRSLDDFLDLVELFSAERVSFLIGVDTCALQNEKGVRVTDTEKVWQGECDFLAVWNCNTKDTRHRV